MPTAETKLSAANVTREWAQQNCRCMRDKMNYLLCQVSCPIHDPTKEYAPGVREALEAITKELGWKLHWERP